MYAVNAHVNSLEWEVNFPQINSTVDGKYFAPLHVMPNTTLQTYISSFKEADELIPDEHAEHLVELTGVP